jgi:hypothetical protein
VLGESAAHVWVLARILTSKAKERQANEAVYNFVNADSKVQAAIAAALHGNIANDQAARRQCLWFTPPHSEAVVLQDAAALQAISKNPEASVL